MGSTARRRVAVGRYGEQLAARMLQAHGMTLLDSNWRCELGELDLVCRDVDVLVAVEVKTRASEVFGSALEAVTQAKAARLRRLVARYLAEAELEWSPREVRIDVIGVLIPTRGAPQVDYVRGVS